MNLTEDRLRTALTQTAQEIPPGSIRPLELPAGPAPGPDRGNLARSRPLRRWLPVLGAVAAVCLIIGLSVVVTPGHRHASPATRRAQFPPPYYVALPQLPCARCGAAVRATGTGKLLATIAPPRPYDQFSNVRGTADPAEFVLSAERPASTITGFFLLSLDPAAGAGHRARLRTLPVTLVTALHTLITYALSPNGQLLATITTPRPDKGRGQPEIGVSNLVTGTHRTWLLPTGSGIHTLAGTLIPQWEPDSRTLALFEATTGGSASLALLDTSAPSSSFAADSRVVPLPEPPGAADAQVIAALLAPDGRHLVELGRVPPIAVSIKSAQPASFELITLNLRSGVARLLRRSAFPIIVLASDTDGSAVIVAAMGALPGNHLPLPQYYEWTARGTSAALAPAGMSGVAW